MKYAIFQAHHVQTFSYLLFLRKQQTSLESGKYSLNQETVNKREALAETTEHLDPS